MLGITYTPLRDDTGAIIDAFHHAHDISARLIAEAELRDAQEVLRQSQKLEAVGQLTGGVAHDFNNLLTVIKSSSDLLKRPDLLEEQRTRYIAAISDTVDRAAKLNGQLLAFARRQALKPEVFEIGDALRGIGGTARSGRASDRGRSEPGATGRCPDRVGPRPVSSPAASSGGACPGVFATPP